MSKADPQRSLTNAMGGLGVGTLVEKEYEAVLAEAGVDVGKAVMAPKLGKGKPGQVALTTNVYGLKVSDVAIFRYDVKIIAGLQPSGERTIEVTKKTKGDSITIDRRDRARDLFTRFREMFMRGQRCVYYDLQSILFSLDKLIDSRMLKQRIYGDQLPESCGRFAYVDFEIQPVRGALFQTRLNDMSNVSADLEQVEHSLLQFIDLATSQYAMFHPEEHVTFSTSSSYLMVPERHGFKDEDLAYFPENDSYLAAGAQKTAHYIEGPESGGKSIGVTIETKKTAFHSCAPLLPKALKFARDLTNLSGPNHDKLNRQLKGLHVETTHLKDRSQQKFAIKEISRGNAINTTFNVDENTKVSVNDYFKQKHDITLKNPDIPLVVVMGGDKDNPHYFPMEVLQVCDNQRVKPAQTPGEVIQTMIKKCAVPPIALVQQNLNTAKSLKLWESDYLRDAGIVVSAKPLDVQGNQLETPQIQFNKDSRPSRPRADNCTWQMGPSKFLQPAAISTWAFYALLSDGDLRRFSKDEHSRMAKLFVDEARKRGMAMPEPVEMRILSGKISELHKVFDESVEKACEFLLIIHSDKDDAIHAEIKYAERRTSIVTQAIRLGTVRNVLNKSQHLTVSNIVNKTNVKFGGLNYSLALDNRSANVLSLDDTLYIGFSSNHPGGGLGFNAEDAKVDSNQAAGQIDEASAPPTIVGYAANVGVTNAFEFIGDFVFQTAQRDEKIKVIQDIVVRCARKFKAHRQHYPKRIVLLRNGCDEGQFATMLKYEVPLITQVLGMMSTPAKLTVLVVNKHQNIRFFNRTINPADRASMQNIRPGVVVDTSVVNPAFNEFFLTSHVALQGTARTPRYTVLFDQNRYDLSTLQNIVFQLSFGHQIVFMPTSLPSPVYLANRYAERGRKLYMCWRDANPMERREKMDYGQLSELLGYNRDEWLGNWRVNA